MKLLTFSDFRLPHRAELNSQKKKKRRDEMRRLLEEIKVFVKYEEYTESHNQHSRTAIASAGAREAGVKQKRGGKHSVATSVHMWLLTTKAKCFLL